MNRADLIRRFVLNEICDDFEDIERIEGPIDEIGPACGLTITHDDIIQALRELIELGYAKAWDLSRLPDAPQDYGTPPREEIEPMNPCFARTDEGIAFHKASPTSGMFDGDWLAPEKREELIRLFILDAYGNCTHVRLAHIELHWNSLAERHGIRISRDEFIRALRQLIALGYLTAAYKGNHWQYEGMPPIEEIKPFGVYFWVTGAGWDFLESNPSWWPFEDSDDDGLHLRKDWIPPDA